VTHRGNVAGIHDALVGLATELTDLDDDRLDDVPRLMVVFDQADDTGATSPATGRPSGRRESRRSPRPSPRSRRGPRPHWA
jgi:hypothetical protein